MKKIPLALIYLRLIIGFLILTLSYFHVKHYTTIAIIFFSIGLLSDIFDGIIARRLNISTQTLRRLDSIVDQAFWLLVALATYIECPTFFYNNYIELSILIAFELLTYIVCFIKFRKEVATHAISSKIWTLLLFSVIVQLILSCDSGLLFQVCFYIGVATRMEIIMIILLLKTWTNDVPSVYHAVLLRKGKPIKRNKIFNG
ncbi:hypothetical protein BH10BAC2_BH10BAC2_07780 [soil metagenome]